MKYVILSSDWSLYENRISVSIQCKSIQEYKDNFPDAYEISVQNNELYQLFSKNGTCRKSKFWNDYNNRLIAAKICHSRSEYAKRFNKAYDISLRENEMDQFNWFNKLEHPFDEEAKIHLIYVYIDEENKYFYVGRTLDYNFKTRCSHHRSALHHDVVFRHWKSMNKPVPDPIIVEEELNMLESKIKEHEYEELYISYGYTKLNIHPTGERSSSVGGITKRWNQKTCWDAALTCHSRSEYAQRYSGAYEMSRIFGWLDDYTWFAKRISYDEAYEAACKCKTTSELKKKYPRFYTFFKNNGLLSSLPLKMHIQKMTEEICRAQAKECNSRSDFKRKYTAAWQYALRHNLMDELFGCNSHSLLQGEYNQEIVDKCIAKAKQYDYISTFSRECGFEYRYLQKFAPDILNDILPITKRDFIDITIENCYKYGALCKNKTDFHNRFRKLYEYSKQLNIIDDIFKNEQP